MDRDVILPLSKDLKPLQDLTLLIYILQAVGFLLPITFVVAVVLNYIRRDDARGTWLASHFRWQMRTFWFGLLWAVAGTLLLYVGIGQIILFAATVWVIYRIAKGWLYLTEDKQMYHAFE